MAKGPTISKGTQEYFAAEVYRKALYYGKYNGVTMQGRCFYSVELCKGIVFLMFSAEEYAYIYSVTIHKSWIY